MDLRLLRAFAAVAEQRHFGLAARRLSVTQPALTKQVQSLERELGGRLFDRGRGGATLTELGHMLLPQAEELLDHGERFTRRASLAASGRVGRLSVGFGLSSIEIAPRLVAAFRSAYPDVEVELEDMSSQAQLDAIHSGEIHVGFVRLPGDSRLGQREVGGDRLAVATNGSPITDPAALHEHDVVALARAKGPGLHDQIQAFTARLGIRPRVVQRAHDLQTVLALVAAGVGAALVPSSAATIAPSAVSLSPLPQSAAAWRVGMVWHADRVNPMVRNFLDVASD